MTVLEMILTFGGTGLFAAFILFAAFYEEKPSSVRNPGSAGL